LAELVEGEMPPVEGEMLQAEEYAYVDMTNMFLNKGKL